MLFLLLQSDFTEVSKWALARKSENLVSISASLIHISGKCVLLQTSKFVRLASWSLLFKFTIQIKRVSNVKLTYSRSSINIGLLSAFLNTFKNVIYKRLPTRKMLATQFLWTSVTYINAVNNSICGVSSLYKLITSKIFSFYGLGYFTIRYVTGLAISWGLAKISWFYLHSKNEKYFQGASS